MSYLFLQVAILRDSMSATCLGQAGVKATVFTPQCSTYSLDLLQLLFAYFGYQFQCFFLKNSCKNTLESKRSEMTLYKAVPC